MKVLGKTAPDPIGVALGTGYSKFQSPLGLDGLYKIKEGSLHLLAVVATQPGTGQFRKFIEQAKTEFPAICIWEVHPESVLNATLPRYKFVPALDIQIGEFIHGFRWDKSQG